MEKYFEEADFLTRFINEKQLNTVERKKYRSDYYEKVRSYNSLDRICDIDYSKLLN